MHCLPTVKTNEWRRAHHLKLSKTPVCINKDFYKIRWLCQALTGSAELMLVPLIALCCCECEPVESRVEFIAVKVQWHQKVLLIFGKSTIYRKRRKITLSLSHRRSAQKLQPAGKWYYHLCNMWFQWFKVLI